MSTKSCAAILVGTGLALLCSVDPEPALANSCAATIGRHLTVVELEDELGFFNLTASQLNYVLDQPYEGRAHGLPDTFAQKATYRTLLESALCAIERGELVRAGESDARIVSGLDNLLNFYSDPLVAATRDVLLSQFAGSLLRGLFVGLDAALILEQASKAFRAFANVNMLFVRNNYLGLRTKPPDSEQDHLEVYNDFFRLGHAQQACASRTRLFFPIDQGCTKRDCQRCRDKEMPEYLQGLYADRYAFDHAAELRAELRRLIRDRASSNDLRIETVTTTLKLSTNTFTWTWCGSGELGLQVPDAKASLAPGVLIELLINGALIYAFEVPAEDIETSTDRHGGTELEYVGQESPGVQFGASSRDGVDWTLCFRNRDVPGAGLLSDGDALTTRLSGRNFTTSQVTRLSGTGRRLGSRAQCPAGRAKLTYYRDADLDGYGDQSRAKPKCAAPTGYSPYGNDCDDDNAAVHQEASEICDDTIDNDCDSKTDCADPHCASAPVCAGTTCTPGQPCRPSAGECDPVETCTSEGTCPADARSAAGTSCTSDGNPCTLDQCDGTSAVCQHVPGNAGATCRTGIAGCDPAETCTGSSAICPPDVNNCVTERYTDNGDGTVTDTQTGLQWEKKTGTVGVGVLCSPETPYADPHDVKNCYRWQDTVFTQFLATLNSPPCFAGHCDWRLPKSGGRPDLGLPSGEPAELETIVDLSAPGCGGGSSPCIDPLFGPTVPDVYWSATTMPTVPSSVFSVGFYDGGVFDTSKHFAIHVRAVRDSLRKFTITHNPRSEPDPALGHAADNCHANNPQCSIDYSGGAIPPRHGHFFRDINIAQDDSSPTLLTVRWHGPDPEAVVITTEVVDRDDRTDGAYGTDNCPVATPPAPAVAIPCANGVGDAIDAGHVYPNGVAIPDPSTAASGFTYYFNGDISQTSVTLNPDGLGRYVPVQFNATIQNATVNVPGRYIVYLKGTSTITGETFVNQVLLVVGTNSPGYREQ